MTDEAEDIFAPLIALAADKTRRLELLTPDNLKLAARFMNRDPQRYVLFLGRLSAWESFSFFKTQVTRRSALNKRHSKEEKEAAEAMERLAKAENIGLALIREGHPTEIARDFLAQVYPHLLVTGDSFLVYRDNHYAEYEKATVRSELQKWLDNAVSAETGNKVLINRRVLDDVMDAIRNAAHVPADEVRPPTWLSPGENDPEPGMVLACRNGLLDIATETLHPNTPRFFTRNGLTYDYEDPFFILPPTEFLAFLESIWPEAEGGRANKESLQEWFGYLLTASAEHQKILLLMGESRAGKGVILKIIDALIGSRNIASMRFAALKNPHGSSALLGKSVMMVPDLRLSKDDSAVVELILALSGDDAIDINRKYRDFISARLGIRIVLATNVVLTVPDQSGAFANRLHPLVFTKSFMGREDTKLADRIVANEIPGILRWALEGLRRLEDRGRFVLPPASARVLQGIRHQAGPVSTFVKERCVLEEGAMTRKRDLWRAFESYCSDLDIPNRYSPESFGRDLIKNATGFFKVDTTRVTLEGGQARVYTGVRLTEEAARDLAEFEDDY